MPRAVAELFEHLSRTVHAMSFSAGLNPAQWNALRFLARANPSARTMSAFAQSHQTTKSTASQTLSALERKRLIRKVPDPEDRRVVRLDLTPKGEKLLSQDPITHLVEALEAIPAEDLVVIARAIETMAHATFAARRMSGELDSTSGA